MLTNLLKVYFDKISPDDYEALAAKKCYGIEKEKNPIHYLGWIPRFLELFAKIRQARKRITLLRTSCSVYQSSKDELISKHSVNYLNCNSCVSVTELKNSGHYYYDKSDWDFLQSEFCRMLKINT
jgi:esterase/lipase